MKKTVTAYVHMAYDYDSGSSSLSRQWRPVIKQYQYEDEECVVIGEQQFTVEIPDDFDPIPGQVAALEEKKREALAEYQRTIAEINDLLSKLQAIGFAP